MTTVLLPPQSIGNLKQLMFMDASKNQLRELPGELEGCENLADLHLTSNSLMGLPDSIGNLNNLTTLKADDNQLTSLPKTLGGFVYNTYSYSLLNLYLLVIFNFILMLIFVCLMNFAMNRAFLSNSVHSLHFNLHSIYRKPYFWNFYFRIFYTILENYENISRICNKFCVNIEFISLK